MVLMENSGVVSVYKDDLGDDQFVLYKGETEIAWDIETDGLDWENGRIGTCQIHGPTAGTSIVQIGPGVPGNLLTLLESSEVTKVFHHAPFDLRFMMYHWKAKPKNIDCTKVASKLLHPSRPSSSHSLKEILHENLGVSISKAERLSEWTSETLSTSQIEYASRDVLHLIPLFYTLRAGLKECGRLDVYLKCREFLPTRVLLEVERWPDVFAY